MAINDEEESLITKTNFIDYSLMSKLDRDKIFGDNSKGLDKLLKTKRGRWRLDLLTWMDYDDVCQIIRQHIYRKLHLWKSDRPFLPWANSVICRQTMNLVDKYHNNKARPCLSCKWATDDAGCAIFGAQGEPCKLFKKWLDTKASLYYLDFSHNLQISGGEETDSRSFDADLDVEEKIPAFHAIMQKKLDPVSAKIYKLAFIDNLGSVEIAKEMGYQTKSGIKSIGYKYVEKTKKDISDLAKKITQEEEIFSI